MTSVAANLSLGLFACQVISAAESHAAGRLLGALKAYDKERKNKRIFIVWKRFKNGLI